MRKSQASVALRPVEIPPLYRIWRIPPTYSVVHHEFLAIGRLNPVLCLDAIPQVGQMSPGVGHNYYIIINLNLRALKFLQNFQLAACLMRDAHVGAIVLVSHNWAPYLLNVPVRKKLGRLDSKEIQGCFVKLNIIIGYIVTHCVMQKKYNWVMLKITMTWTFENM